MFAKQKQDISMNLPVANHIDRLAQMIGSMKSDVQNSQRQLQILRGSITQLSYINKQSDKELNQFLVEGIASLRNRWGADWDLNQDQLLEHKKKITKLAQEHEDVDISREQLQERVLLLEGAVGLGITSL